jgi:hypothetical protein
MSLHDVDANASMRSTSNPKPNPQPPALWGSTLLAHHREQRHGVCKPSVPRERSGHSRALFTMNSLRRVWRAFQRHAGRLSAPDGAGNSRCGGVGDQGRTERTQPARHQERRRGRHYGGRRGHAATIDEASGVPGRVTPYLRLRHSLSTKMLSYWAGLRKAGLPEE